MLNNDLHHPVPLAQEVATLDQLSGGRVEVGLGAGHSFTEYTAMGQPFDPPATRKERLAESVEILRALLDGGPVSRRGAHYRIDEAVTLAPRQEHVPLLVGVNGRAALAHAVRHADIVAPTMLGRTREDGQHHDVRWEASRLDATVEWMRHEAGERWDGIELHALVQAVVITGRPGACRVRDRRPDRDGRGRRRVHPVPLHRDPRGDRASTCWPVGSAGGSATTACATCDAFAPDRVRRWRRPSR